MTPEAQELYREVLLAEDAMALRIEFCRIVSEQLGAVASWLGLDSILGGGDLVDAAMSTKPEPDRYAAFRGASSVVEMAAELTAGAVSELTAERRYAAAALIRQLIEAEYLLSAFVEDVSRAATWHRSTPTEIRKSFMPKTMRPLGGFSDHEYWTHCDQGGHPSPQGRFLLRFGGLGPDDVITASMWADLARHLGRVWKATHALLAVHHARFLKVRANEIATVEAIWTRWSETDQLSGPINLAMFDELASGAPAPERHRGA